MTQSLPVSRLVKVSVTLTPRGAQSQSLSSLLVLGTSAVIDTVERWRTYESIEALALDFGNTTPEYLSALAWFQQAPQPTSIRIGRWVKTNAAGTLRGGALSATQQLMSNFTGIAAGAFSYSLNGAANSTIAALNFTAATNLNQVASIITSALTGAVMTWNAAYSRFELTSLALGDTSSVSFLGSPSSGTDISALLGMTSTFSGAYRAPGVDAETALEAVTMFDNMFGQSWYAVMVPDAVTNDHLQLAAYLEATNTKHLYAITTQEAGTLVPSITTDLASQLKEFRYNKTVILYSSSNPYAVASLLARILTVDYEGSNTAITLAFKQLPGITDENINSVQADSLKAKNVNSFLAFNNDTSIVVPGVASSGEFVDVVTGTDWVAVELQNRLWNVLYTSPTKIPQTDAGTQLLVVTAETVLAQAVTNGLCAPGVWNSAGFGSLKQGDYLPKGYYIYAQRVDEQNIANRAARKSVPIQAAMKLAGAVHEVNLSVSVNQ